MKTDKKKHVCAVVGCDNEKRRRYLLCPKCWDKLPVSLKFTTRDLPRQDKGDKEKATHQSLRAVPTQNWFETAMRYVGKIRTPMTWGHGISAVKVVEQE